MKHTLHNTVILVFLLSIGTQSGIQAQENLTFKWLRPVLEQNLRPYSGNLAAFYEAGKWGYEDIDGKVVIPAEYEEAGNFINGAAIVKKAGKWGVITPTGDEVYQCIYDTISPFSGNGIALASIDKSWYYLHIDGKIQSLPSDLTFHTYHNGLAKVMKKVRGHDRYGYIDTKGYFVIEPIFDEASDFFGDNAFVSINGRHYSINTKGKRKILDFPYIPGNTFLSSAFGCGFMKQGERYMFIKYEKGIYSLIPTNFIRISGFKEGYALVQTPTGRFKYIKTNGTTAVNLPEDCTAAGDFSEGKAWVCIDGKYGFINSLGAIVIDTVFSYASDFNNGVAYVAYKDRQGIIRQSSAGDMWPDLRIGSVTIQDDNHNGNIESGEHFKIRVILNNAGDEQAENVVVTLTGQGGQAEWISYDTNRHDIPRIEPGESVAVTFEGDAGMDIVSDNILVNFKAVADNQMSFPQSSLTFRTLGINQCRPLLASYWVHTPDHSDLTPGKSGVIEFSVINEGSDIAKDVTVNMRWPSGISSSSSEILLGDINPGETKNYAQAFVLDSTASPSGHLSVVASLSEFTKKHTDIKYMMFETGKMNLAVNLLGTSSNSYYVTDIDKSRTQDNRTGEQESELLSGLTRIKEPDQNKYALIIGNEDYNSLKQKALYEPNVDFAASDAETFAEYAKNILGVPEDNIVLLTNATYSQMRQNVNKIAHIASLYPGQTELYVYYAGHGQIDGNSKECFLIPVDVSTTSPADGIRLEDLYTTLSESNAKRTLVFLDACYSGFGRGIILQPKKTPIKGNMVVMTASSATQKSMPYQEKRHGMFTYFLLRQLKESFGDITLEELFRSVKSDVQSNSVWINNMEQTPELLTGPGIAEDWKEWRP